jgi:hypothetical protein
MEQLGPQPPITVSWADAFSDEWAASVTVTRIEKTPARTGSHESELVFIETHPAGKPLYR